MNNIIHKLQTSIQVFCVALSIIFTGVLCIPESTYAATLAKPANNLGLVSYWSFDDASGTVATDFSGNGKNGTALNLSNPATATSGWGAGKLGGGINFDATKFDGVYVSNATPLGSVFTFSMWVKPSSLSTNQVFAGTFSSNGWLFRNSAFTNKRLEFYNGATNYTSSNTTLTTGVWQLITVTYDGSYYKFYYNGALDYTSSPGQGAPNSESTLYISRLFGGYGVSGAIDEVRQYSRALSATEITSLYNAGAQKLNVPRNKTGTSLDSGLVGLWSFDGKDMNGTTAFDRSGSGNNGTLTNGATTTTGKFGQAARFDGVNDYSGAQYDLARASSTISVWIKTTVKDQGISQWSSVGYTYNGFTDRVLTLNSSGQARLYVYNGGACTAATYYITGGADLSDNNWHHIVGVWGPSGKDLYVDGVLVANNTDGIQSSTGSMPYLTVGEGDPGCSHSPVRQYFNGSIDDVRVYNRSLSSTEITKLYTFGAQTVNASRNTTGGSLDSGLVGLWSFDGKDMNGTTAFDRSGSGNNGTLTNGPVPAIGKIGQAVSFDGTNDYVDAGTSFGNFAATDAFTISAWIYASPSSTGISSIVTRALSGGKGWYLSYDSDGTFGIVGQGMFFDYFDGVNYVRLRTNNSDVPMGTWVHVVLVKTGGSSSAYNYSIYVNGVDKTVVVNAGAPSNVDYTGISNQIGARGGANTFLGKIDEVRVYNRALSAAEVKSLYNLGK